jgi:hypothetical protein
MFDYVIELKITMHYINICLSTIIWLGHYKK